jgi:arylsulfatase A-like enzyme
MPRRLVGLVLLALTTTIGSYAGPSPAAEVSMSPTSAITGPSASATSIAKKPSRKVGRPNVVMMIVDDMRADDLQYMPSTRRLLGDGGVTFANSFAPYPLCCPARASIFTGQYTHNHGVYTTHAPYAFPALKDQSTLATWLQDGGYSTVFLGKYMNGYGYLPRPGRSTGNSLRYVPPGWTDWRASIEGGLPKGHPDHGSTYLYFNTTLSDNGRGFSNYKGQYQSDVYGTLSRRIILDRAASKKPFFLYASYAAPHNGGPREPDDLKYVTDDQGNTVKLGSPARPDWVKGRFDDVITAAPGADWSDPDPSDKPEHLRTRTAPNAAELEAMLRVTRQRAESLYVVDKQVKRTVQALADSGELDNTLVIFTSDNGYFLGEQGIRAGKILPHDPSLRTPLLMRGPGIPAGEVREDPFLSIDFAPTIAAAARVTPRLPVDGVSMLDVARRGDTGWHRAVLTETGPRSVVRDTDEAGRALAVDDPGPRDLRWMIGIRTSRYLYVDLASKEEELYDMATDPEQYHNVVTDPAYADVLSLLREQLARLRACDAADCRAPLPEHLATGPRSAG